MLERCCQQGQACAASHEVVGEPRRWCVAAVGHADRGEPGILPQVRHPALLRRPALLARGVAYLPRRSRHPGSPIAITGAKSRDQQWKEAWPVIRQTLMSRGSVLGHCVAGRHRAARGQALILSLITDTTFCGAPRTL